MLRCTYLPLALLALGAPAIAPAQTYGPTQSYGPAVVDEQYYEMYRGDSLDINIEKEADWAKVDGEAVAAILSTGNKLRLVAVKTGKAEVTVTNHEKLVWRAAVVVR
ncbi:hypothetical protein GRI89_06300 [Altererythrobacter salegens]|uniref:Uncharacterized protein n=1 Tax=Croceibacterium salegens TaxID=1737568 RepID=A0A6I4SUM0_9SPHN|nr:hypothetical protein [Croceibacterium salegens]MXO59148.1 hypothetical protein [Croceibacterium salegens]